MSYEEFILLKGNSVIDRSLHPLLQALLYDAAGDWDAAHRIAQDDPSDNGSWVHAYLHRKEPDAWNARYWYTRARKPEPSISLDEEWELLSKALLTQLI